MTRTKAVVAAIALAFSLSLVGCGNDRVIECDTDDQAEFDSDCGYWKQGQFIQYSWVTPGKTSYSPAGFQQTPNDSTAPTEEAEHSRSKPKRKPQR